MTHKSIVYNKDALCPDSDEEIAVSRKGRSRKALQDSDSDGNLEEAGMENALVLSESSDEQTKTGEAESIKDKRGKRVSRISMMESDESEPEKADVQSKPKEAKKKREKSERRKDKEKRNAALVKRLKEKTEVCVRIM